MKILVFADPHGVNRSLQKVYTKAKAADLVISVGDFTMFEQDLRKILLELDNLDKKILIVHGNHENEHTVKKICDQSKNLIFIHDGFYKTDDWTFLGYGGGGFSFTDNYFESRTKLYKQVINKKSFILILHQPPFGLNLDVVSGNHVGSKSFTQFIEETQPVRVFCGHIHPGFGKTDTIGKSIVTNPGPEGTFFEI